MSWLLKLFGERVNDCKIDGDKIFLFWDGTKHYHAWSVNGNEQYVWPKVKEAQQKDRRRMDIILINGNAYSFIEDDKIGMYSESITKSIELYHNNNIISSFVLELRHEDYGLLSVEFIKQGEWQKDIIDFLAWKKENDELMRHNINELMERNRREKLSKTLND